MRSCPLTLVSTDSAWLGGGLDPQLSCTNLGLSKDPEGSPLHSHFKDSQGPLSLQTEPCWVQGGGFRGETQPPAHCREGKPVTPHTRGQTSSCIFQSSSQSITSLPSPDYILEEHVARKARLILSPSSCSKLAVSISALLPTLRGLTRCQRVPEVPTDPGTC